LEGDRYVHLSPLLGWATAWSFDGCASGLREGFRRKFRKFALVYLVARSTIAFMLYHGLVPKLL